MEEEENFTDNIINGFKNWLKFFVIGVWSLILFGILGFVLFAYVAFTHIDTLEKNHRPHHNNINKGQNIYARYKN